MSFSECELDALKETGNIGAGNTASALAMLTNAKIDMSVPLANVLTLDEVINLVGGYEQMVTGILLRINGSISATILFVLTEDSAKTLIKMIYNQFDCDFSGLEESALKELGNILVGAYLNALHTFTKLNMFPSVPAIAVDMAGALLDLILSHLAETDDNILVLDTEFRKDEESIIGHFLLFPEAGALKKILEALKVSE